MGTDTGNTDQGLDTSTLVRPKDCCTVIVCIENKYISLRICNKVCVEWSWLHPDHLCVVGGLQVSETALAASDIKCLIAGAGACSSCHAFCSMFNEHAHVRAAGAGIPH